jgi:hypothetical protein
LVLMVATPICEKIVARFYLILRQVGDNVPSEVLQNLLAEYGVVGGVHPNILRPRAQPKKMRLNVVYVKASLLTNL